MTSGVVNVTTRKSGSLGLTSVLFSIAFVALSVLMVDSRKVFSQLAHTNPRWLGAFFVVSLVQVALLGLRWSTIARRVGVPLGVRRATSEYALSLLVNQILPTGIAGDGWRAFRHAQRTTDKRLISVLEPLALDRLSGQIGLVLVALASVPLTFGTGLFATERVLWALAALLVASVAAMLILNHFASDRPRVAKLRAVAVRAVRVLFDPRWAVVHLSLSVILIGTLLVQLYIAGRAIGADLDWRLLLQLGPPLLLAASVPSFFGGWGVREGAGALLFTGLGLSGSTGVAMSLAFGAFALISALPGCLVVFFDGERQGVLGFMALRKRLPTSPAATPVAPSPSEPS